MTKSCPKHARDNRANQLNPTHPVYYRSRGVAADGALSCALDVRRSLDPTIPPDTDCSRGATLDSPTACPASRNFFKKHTR